MKKINTDSRIYRALKDFSSFVGAIGSGLAVEAVLLPFTEWLWDWHPVFKNLSRVGVVVLSEIVAFKGMDKVEYAFDWTAEGYNLIADYVNAKHEAEEAQANFIDASTPSNDYKNFTPEEEKLRVNDFIVDTKLLEFSSEEDAKAAGEWLFNQVTEYGFCDIWEFVKHKGIATDNGIFTDVMEEILRRYGWEKNVAIDYSGKLGVGQFRVGVDRIGEKLYILDVFSYHDISHCYNIFGKEQ